MEKSNHIKALLCYCLTVFFLFSARALSQDSDAGLKKPDGSKKEIHSSGNARNLTEEDSRSSPQKIIYSQIADKTGDVKFSQTNEDAETGDEKSPLIISSDDYKIEPSLVSGGNTTQAFTIKNSGKSVLIWNVVTDGSDKLLFRVYKKDRFLSELNDIGKENISDVISYEKFEAEKTALKLLHNRTNTNVNEVSSLIVSHKDKVKPDNDGDVSSALFTEEIIHSYHNEIFEDNTNGIDLRDQLKVFQQWYRFMDCGYPVFDPRSEVWEVSQDDGENWQQILSIDDETYVVNAECFNPIDFLEYGISDLISLDEFVHQAERGLSVFPRSGIIPAGAASDIEIEVDATLSGEGTYSTRIVFTDAESMQMIEILNLSFNVKPASEKDTPDQLYKPEVNNQLPDKYELSQNFPNPFNPATNIKYDLPQGGNVTVKIFDVLGSEIATLVNEEKQAGFYEVNFNAADLPSGVYIYRIQAGDYVQTRKMLLLK